MDFFAVRWLASFAVDFSLAWLCGLLLVRLWLRAATPMPLPSLLTPTLTLAGGSALQLLTLTAAFTGHSAVPALLRALPDIAATHAGAVLALALAATLLLVGLVLIPARPRYPMAALALTLCLLLRAGAGHAATESFFSYSQMLQFLHLAGMAAWSGGVLVAGLWVLPRTAPDAGFGGVLRSLSRSSSVAVCVVLLSGAAKGYHAVAWDVPTLTEPWGLTLLLKLACVSAALALAGLNRLWLGRTLTWTPAQHRRSLRALRAEAAAMALILALSAALANLSPPGG